MYDYNNIIILIFILCNLWIENSCLFCTGECPWSPTEAAVCPGRPPLLHRVTSTDTQRQLLRLETLRGQSPTTTPAQVQQATGL